MQGALGKTSTELIGTLSTDVLDRRDHAEIVQLLGVVRGGGHYRMPIRYMRPNGSLRVGSLTVTPIHTDGVVTGGLAIVRDTTDEEVLRESSAQHARLAAVGQLLGGVANELNNPLASLLAVAELGVGSPTLHESDRDAIRQIRDEARRASQIVSELLDSTTERTRDRSSDRAAERPSDRGSDHALLDLNRIATTSLELHGYSLRRRGITVLPSLPVTPILVRGDGGQLRQLLINVLTNAEDALDGWPGVREIRVTTRVDGETAVLDISDSGPGGAPVHLRHVFEPTFSARSERGRRGYGLTISRAIARGHGGDLALTSPHGGGASVTLTLPLVAPASAETDAPARDLVGGTAVERSSASVLLVENEPTLRTAVSRYLESAGYDVHLASGGEEALAQLSARTFDVVLLDLRMDDLPGDDVYRVLERRDASQAARVLFITGDMHSDTASDFVRGTGRPVLPKPFRLSDLAERIAEMLQVPELRDP